MKRFVLFWGGIILSALVSFFEPETILTLNQTSFIFNDAGESQTISLTANKPWTASSNQSWCKVSPSFGEEAANSRITITCEANTTYDSRNCTVTFTCAELTKTVSFSQVTNNGLIVSQTEYNITNAAQQLEINVQANVKFSVDVDNGCKSWVKYNTTKGLSNSIVVLDIAKNEAYDGREGKVFIKQTDGSLFTIVMIKQGQTDGLFLTSSDYSLSNEKHTLTVEVKSNIDFEVKPEVDWIKFVETKGLKTNQIVLDIAANETYDEREGKVTLKQKNGNLSGIITIKQDEKYGILVSQSDYNLTNDAQTIDVEVKYNVDFDVIIPEECKDWISFVSTKSLDSRTYIFSISKNESYDDRKGSITFKQKNGTLGVTVSVTQEHNNGLFVAKTDYELSNESQIVIIEVKANINYTIKSEADWIEVVDTKGLKTSSVMLSVTENVSHSSRNGRVEIIREDCTLAHIVSIKQLGRIAVSSIKLDKNNLSMIEGCVEELVATVEPENATDKTVTWKSSSPDVAVVDDNGRIQAVKEGFTVITAEAGMKRDSCTIQVNPIVVPKGAVDLGIIITKSNNTSYRLFWAECNLGSTAPEDYGEYYAWGELITKQWYNRSTYTITKYNDEDNLTVLESTDDVAHVTMGERWRMPTKEEFDALCNQCTIKETVKNGVSGYEFISTADGNTNSIFLPCAGYRTSDGLFNINSMCSYWTASLANNKSLAYCFGSTTGLGFRYCGCSIRPVSE